MKIRLTETELVKLIDRIVNEQINNKQIIDPKKDATKNKNWLSIKSALIPMGFKSALTKSSDDSGGYSAYVDVQGNQFKPSWGSNIETLSRLVNGNKISVQWPAGSIEQGGGEPNAVRIFIELKRPTKYNFGQQLTQMVNMGPKINQFDGGTNFWDNNYMVDVNLIPNSIIDLIKKLISLINKI